MIKAAKFLFYALELIFLALFAIPIILLGIINAGSIFGILLCVVAFLCTYFSNSIFTYFKKLCRTTGGKTATSAISLLLIGAISLTVYAGAVILFSADNPPDRETTVIVLGCKVNSTGPSLMLQSRIDAAYEFLKDNPNAKCIVSGGQGDDEHISEAKCMYDELVKMGIEKDRIYMEDKSSTTRENIAFSKKIIEKEGLCKDITIVTNDFHQYRASVIAKDQNLESYNVPADTPIYMFPSYFLREIGGFLFEMVF